MSSTSPSGARAAQRQAVKDAWESFLSCRFDSDATGVDLLDMELEVVQQELLPLARRKRNAHKRACKLPVEVLTAIFAYLQVTWRPRRLIVMSGSPAAYANGWIAVSKVCSAWRKVALGTPTLWCNLNYLSFHPKSMVEIISRSKALPLTLKIAGKSTQEELAGWLCGPVNKRIKKLSITVKSRSELFDWIELLYPAMPMLEHFDLNIQADVRDDPAPHILPTAFLGGLCPPRMKMLLLNGVICSWDSPLLSSSLDTVCLCGENLDDILPPSEVANTLARMVNLRCLVLRDVLPNEIHAGAQPLLVPPALSRLDLESTSSSHAPSIPAFLNQFVTWPASDISISTRFTDPDDVTLDATLYALFSPHQRKMAPSEMFLSYETINMLYQEISPRSRWTTDPRPKYMRRLHQRPAFERHIHVFFGEDEDDRTLVDKLSLLPLAGLNALYLTSDVTQTILGDHAWIEGFATAANMSRLAGYYADLHDLVCALGVVQDDASESASGNSFALFPALEVLVFHTKSGKNAGPAAGPGNTTKNAEPQEPAFAKNNAALVNLLAVRESRGRPIKEILVDKAMAGWDFWGMPAVLDATQISFF